MISAPIIPTTRGLSGWLDMYIRTLHLLSGKLESDPEAQKAVRFLEHLAAAAWAHDRGDVYIPTPLEGRYPITTKITREMVKTAVRPNARPETRERAWERIRNAVEYRRYARQRADLFKQKIPPGLASAEEVIEALKLEPGDPLYEAVMISFPRYPGDLRTPPLGKVVPRQGRSRATVASVRELGEDWERGFTPMKFAARKTIRFPTFSVSLPTLRKMRKSVPKGSFREKMLRAAIWTKEHPYQVTAAKLGALLSSGIGGWFLGKARGKELASRGEEPTNRDWALGAVVPLYDAGMYWQLIKAKKKKQEQHALQEEILAYQAGIEEGFREKIRRKIYPARVLLRKAYRALRREALPAAVRAALIGALSQLHMETGLLPGVTIDEIPLRKTLPHEARPELSESALERLKANLQSRLETTRNKNERRELKDRIREIEIAEAIRGKNIF